MDLSPSASIRLRLRGAADFNLLELAAPGGLRFQFHSSGALFAIRHRETLLNQFLPGPAEDGLFRLLLRWRDSAGRPLGWAPLVGPALDFDCDRHAVWRARPQPGLEAITLLALHPTEAAWAWRVRLHNQTKAPLQLEVLHAQDLGLADEAAVRNNEAYVSQYLDLLPVTDPGFGPVVLARQNQPASGGRRPWAAFACATGAAAFCTDGSQFFGADHRLTNEPAAVRDPALPSRRLQYECAVAGLQSRVVSLAAGAETEIVFVARFVEDHPAASTPADVALLREILPAFAFPPPPPHFHSHPASLFHHAPWLAGQIPTATDLAAWFPGPHRHVERDAGGRELSFFCDRETHAVTRGKETLVARPHGHILRSGDARWPDDAQFGLTCYAAGIFGAQAYLGNPGLARLLSVVRHSLNVARANGQRVFVRHDGAWRQLGVPSAFAMEPGAVRWFYRLADRVLAARVTCSATMPASCLRWEVLSGPPTEFLVTHQLAFGANEFEAGGELEVHADGWLAAPPGSDSFIARHLPQTCFALAAVDPAVLAAHGGDELLYADCANRRGPYAVFQTRAVLECAFILLGEPQGPARLAEAVARARAEFNVANHPPAQPPAAPLRLSLPSRTSNPSGDKPASHDAPRNLCNLLGYKFDPVAAASVARLDEVLPWFTHNAAIHFSAPHGLEQYGGGAWGVRDVTQGSVEWLLAAGDFATVRRTLTAVFEQQYALSPRDPAVAGCWPQWFMFAPFRFIQQTHSHGDVCFWPLKALCDYAEAGNDLAFLDTAVGYTDPEHFRPAGPAESLWAHCDRIIAHAESRFLPGTALVNYGDGDWDDTLQPADPSMRTRMVSAWTVGLAYHAFRQFAEVSRHAGHAARAGRLDALLTRMRADFARLAMPDGIVAGFLVKEPDGRLRPLLHPADRVTGIRYRLLPMTRSVLAELFTPEEARRHAALIESELRFADGVRLMSEPAAYHGGLETLFKRADTAANVGREIGLQYVHAHIRYAEAMAKLGDADRLWTALQVVNPVGLDQAVPLAAPRQSNVYFSSSDADFADRIEAAARWPELRAGRVPVRGGWRLYSSGPGLFLHKIRACLLGLRESFNDVVFDPVLPRSLDGLTAETHLLDRPVRLVFAVRQGTSAPSEVRVNGTAAAAGREANPYRPGGLRVARAELARLLRPTDNLLEILL